MARANRRTGRLRSRALRNLIHSRRLNEARKTEDAWEAEKARPIRELLQAGVDSGLQPWEMQKEIRKIQQKHWPVRNRIGKRWIGIWGITKEMRSRSRRHLNKIVVAD